MTSFAEFMTAIRRLERNTDALMTATTTLAGAIEDQTKMLEELNEWLREPPPSTLSDALAAITAKLDEIAASVASLGGRQ
jgi:uncharacterized protein YukE